MLLQAPPTAPNTVFYLSLTLRSLAMQLTEAKEQPWEKVGRKRIVPWHVKYAQVLPFSRNPPNHNY